MEKLQDVFLGKNLKRLRSNEDFSQLTLVAKMQLLGSNMSRTTYNKIENGIRNIYVSDLIRLQRIYSVSFDEFFKDLEI